MRVVMLEAPPGFLAERRRLGLDRRDEMWEGELHMVPPPHERHGRLEGDLYLFFRLHWKDLGLGRLFLEAGVKRRGATLVKVAGEEVPSDYRTPDMSFLLPARYDRVQSGWIVGGPDVALEIVSPGDESRKKLPFYFSVGVTEAILVDRDTFAVEVLRAGASDFEPVAQDAAGWVRSEILRSELRQEEDAAGKPVLHVRRSDEPARELLIGD